MIVTSAPFDLTVFSTETAAFGIFNNFFVLDQHSDKTISYTLTFTANNTSSRVMIPVMEEENYKYQLYDNNGNALVDSSGQPIYFTLSTHSDEVAQTDIPQDAINAVVADPVPEGYIGKAVMQQAVYSSEENSYLAGQPKYNTQTITLDNYYAFPKTGDNAVFLESDGKISIKAGQTVDFTTNDEFIEFLKANNVIDIQISYDNSNDENAFFYGTDREQHCWIKFNGDDLVNTDHQLNTFTSTDYLDYAVSVVWNDDGKNRPAVNQISYTLKRKELVSDAAPTVDPVSGYDAPANYETGGALEGYEDYSVLAEAPVVVNSSNDTVPFKVPAYSADGNLYDYIAYRSQEDSALTAFEADQTNTVPYRSERLDKNSFEYYSQTFFDCELSFLDSARSSDSLVNYLNSISSDQDRLKTFISTYFTLYNGEGSAMNVSDWGDVSVYTDTDGKYHLKIKGLDAIDSSGNAISYYLTNSDQIKFKEFLTSPTTDESDYYTVSAVNEGVHSSYVDRIYNGGSAEFLLSGEKQFSGILNWVDKAKEQSRLSMTSGDKYADEFILWRYVDDTNIPEDDRPDMKAQVGKFRVYGGTDDGNNTTSFAYVDSNGNAVDLPKYDHQGRAYVYYAKENSSRLSGYTLTFSGGTQLTEAVTSSGGFGNDATLTYSLEGTVNYVIDAKWIAASLQGGTGTVSYELEKWNGSEWVEVPSNNENGSYMTISGFSAEQMEKSSPFFTSGSAPDMYDNTGDTIVYRIVQTGASRTDGSTTQQIADGKKIYLCVETDGDNKGNFKTITVDGKTYYQINTDGGNTGTASVRITIGSNQYDVSAYKEGGMIKYEYTLVDTVDVVVNKNWGDIPITKFEGVWNTNVTLQLEVLDTSKGEYVPYNSENGNPGTATYTYDGNSTPIQFPNNGTVVVDKTMKVNGNRYAVKIEGLPKFDSQGHINVFKVSETATSSSIDASQTEEVKKTANSPDQLIVTNSMTGDGERIDVYKVWMDDGEEEYKSDVQIEASGRVMPLPMETSSSDEVKISGIDTMSDSQGNDYASQSASAPGGTTSSSVDFGTGKIWNFNGNWEDYVSGEAKFGTKYNTNDNVYPLTDDGDYLNVPSEQLLAYNTALQTAYASSQMAKAGSVLTEGNIYHTELDVRKGYSTIANNYYRLKDFREFLTDNKIVSHGFEPAFQIADNDSDVEEIAKSPVTYSASSPIKTNIINQTILDKVTSGEALVFDTSDSKYLVNTTTFNWLAGVYSAGYDKNNDNTADYTRYYAVQEIPKYDKDDDPTRLEIITFKNTRVGVVNYKVSLNWFVGDALGSTIKEINIQIKADNEIVQFNGVNHITVGVTKDLKEFYITNLPKYYSNGVLINYELQQISIVDNNGHTYNVNNGVWTTGDSDDADRCVVSVVEGEHIINTASNSDDLYPVTITNTFSDTTTLKIYKQWIDDDDFLGKRPDLYIRLFRKVNGAAEKIGSDNRWEYKPSSHWDYEFRNLSKYNSGGYRYTYYVEEITTDLVKAEYVTRYYSDYNPTTRKGTLRTDQNDQYAYNGDTIENKLEKTETIKGTKIWQKMDKNILDEMNYPIADVFLYKGTKVGTNTQYSNVMSSDSNDEHYYLTFSALRKSIQYNFELVNSLQILGGDESFGFEKGGSIPIVNGQADTSQITYNPDTGHVSSYGTLVDLPKYDENGALIKYEMQERAINGYNWSGGQDSDTLINDYVGGKQLQIRFKKNWVNMSGTGTAYPKITVILHQAYIGSEGGNAKLIDYKTFEHSFYPTSNGNGTDNENKSWTNNNYQWTFGIDEDLREYAPTGDKFFYYFTEVITDEKGIKTVTFENNYSVVNAVGASNQIYPEIGSSINVITDISGSTVTAGQYVLSKGNADNQDIGFITTINEPTLSKTVYADGKYYKDGKIYNSDDSVAVDSPTEENFNSLEVDHYEYSAGIENKYEPDETNFEGKLVINKTWNNIKTNNSANSEFDAYENYRFTVSRYTRRIGKKNLFQIITGGSDSDDPYKPVLEVGDDYHNEVFVIHSVADSTSTHPVFFPYDSNDQKIETVDTTAQNYQNPKAAGYTYAYYMCQMTFTKSEYKALFGDITVRIKVYPAGTGKNKMVEIENLAIYGQDGVGYTYVIDEVAASAYTATPKVTEKTMTIDDNGTHTLTFPLTNVLKTFDLKLNAVFGSYHDDKNEQNNYSVLNKDDYSQYFNQQFVNGLTFKIQRKDPGDNTTWGDYRYNNGDGSISGSQLTLGDNGYYFNFEDLPKYKPNDNHLESSTSAYSYRIIQTKKWENDAHVATYYPQSLDDLDITKNSQEYAYVVTPSDSDTSRDTYVRNVFESKKIRLDKFWADDNNADGLRGVYLPVTITETIQDVQTPVIFERTLLAEESWTKNILLAKFYYNGLNPNGNLTYTLSEDLTDVYESLDENGAGTGRKLSELGYTQKEWGILTGSGNTYTRTQQTSGGVNVTSEFDGLYITNQKTRVNSKLTFNKSWDDDSNKWNLRPSTVYIKVLRKVEGGGYEVVKTQYDTNKSNNEPVITAKINDSSYDADNDTGIIALTVPASGNSFTATIEDLAYGKITGGGEQVNGTWDKYLYTVVECDKDGNAIDAELTYSETPTGTEHVSNKLTLTIDNLNELSEDDDGHRTRHIHIMIFDENNQNIKKDIYGNPLRGVYNNKEEFYSGASDGFVKEGVMIIAVPEDESITSMTVTIDDLPISNSYTVERSNSQGNLYKDDSTKEIQVSFSHSITNNYNSQYTSFNFSKTWTDNDFAYGLVPSNFYFKLYRRAGDGSLEQVSDNLSATFSGGTVNAVSGLFTISVNTYKDGNTISGTISNLLYGAFIDNVYKKYTYYAVECDSTGNPLTVGKTYSSTLTSPDQPFVLEKDDSNKYSKATLTESMTNKLNTKDHNLVTTWTDGTDTSSRTAYNVKLQVRSVIENTWRDYDLKGKDNVFVGNETGTQVAVSETNILLQKDQLNILFNDLPAYDIYGNKLQYRVVETKIGTSNVEDNKRYLFSIPNDRSYVVGWSKKGTSNFYILHGFDGLYYKNNSTNYTGWDYDTETSTINNVLVTNPVSYVHIEAVKEWNDEDNLYGKRPDSITFLLKRKKKTYTVDPSTGNANVIEDVWDDTFSYYYTISEETNWKAVWYNCAAFAVNNLNSNTEFTYYVYEITNDTTVGEILYKGLPEGYTLVNENPTPVYDVNNLGEITKSFTFTNTYTPTKVNLDATKIWYDQSNIYSQRPTSVTFELYCKYDIYEYNAQGVITKTGEYNNKVSGSALTGHIEGYGENSVKKTLTASNAVSNNTNKWQVEFEGLPAYVNTSGTALLAGKSVPVTYYIVESFTGTATTDKVKIAYKCADDSDSCKSNEVNLISEGAAVSKSGDSGLSITNTLDTRDIYVTKAWKDNDCAECPNGNYSSLHSNVKVTISSDGVLSSALTGVIDADSTKSLIFRHLPKYNSSTGEVIDYSIAEEFTTDSETAVNANEAVAAIASALYSSGGEDASTLFTQTTGSGKQTYGYVGSCKKHEKTEIENKPFVEQYDITNDLPVTTVTITKSWTDNYGPDSTQNYYYLRPETIGLQLYRTTTVASRSDDPASDTTNWQIVDSNGAENDKKLTGNVNKTTASTDYTVVNLLKFAQNNTEYQFMVVEDDVKAYSTTYTTDITTSDPKTLTVENTLQKRNIDVAKKWDDKSCTDVNSIHYNVKVTLTASSLHTGASDTGATYTDSQVIPADASKMARFTDLPIYDANGGVITYNVTEEYTAADATATVTASFNDNGSSTDGNEFTAPDNSKRKYGYIGTCTKTVDATDSNIVTKYNITNTLPTTKVTVTKTWADSFNSVNDYYNIRPDSINLSLYRTTQTSPTQGSAPGSDESTGWVQVGNKTTFSGQKNERPASTTCEFTALRRFDESNKEYKFEVVEDHVKGYTTAYTTGVTATDTSSSNPVDRALEVTNTLDTRPIYVYKVWNDNGYGGEPGNATAKELHYDLKVTLSSDVTVGSSNGTYSEYKILQKDSDKVLLFADLPKYDADGNVITYNVKEEYVNTSPYTSVDKPNGFADDADEATNVNFVYEENNADHQYGYVGTCTQLSETDTVLNKTYVTKYKITNTLPVMNFEAQKLWDDDKNRDYVRPESVTLKLNQDNNVIKSKTTNEANSWKVTFGIYPKFKTDNTSYSYSVTENTVTSYTSTNSPTVTSFNNTNQNLPDSTDEVRTTVLDDADATHAGTATHLTTFRVKNSYTPIKQSLTIDDVWNDTINTYIGATAYNTDYSNDTRPSEMDVDLYISYGTVGEVKCSELTNEQKGYCGIPSEYLTTFKLKSSDSWQKILNNLPKNINPTGTATTAGHSYPITYSVKQAEHNGYTLSNPAGVTLDSDKTVTITNTLKTADIKVIKEWVDKQTYEGTTDNDYHGTDYSHFAINCTIASTDIGVAVVNSSFVIANSGNVRGSHSNDFILIQNVPVYKNVNNQGAKASYTISETNAANNNPVDLFYNYTKTGSQITINDLPENNTVTEATLINTLQLAHITVTKNWTDEYNSTQNYYGLRPDDVSFEIYRTTKSDLVASLDSANISDDHSYEDTKWVKLTSANNLTKIPTSTSATAASWTYTFPNLLKYDNNNHPYYYMVVEGHVNGYKHGISETTVDNTTDKSAIKASVDASGNHSVIFTNTLDTRPIIVANHWDDESYTDYSNTRYNINATLTATQLPMSGNTNTFSVSKVIAKTQDNGVTFADLPKFDKDGNEVVYVLTEAPTAASADESQVTDAYNSSSTKDAAVSSFDATSRRYGYNGTCKVDEGSYSINGVTKTYVTKYNIKNTLPLTNINIKAFWADDEGYHKYATNDDNRKITFTVSRVESTVNANDWDKDTYSVVNTEAYTSDDPAVYAAAGHGLSNQLVYNYGNEIYTYEVTEDLVKGYTTDYPTAADSSADDNTKKTAQASADNTIQMNIRNTQITQDITLKKIDQTYHDLYSNTDKYKAADLPLEGVKFELYLKDSDIPVPVKLNGTHYEYDYANKDNEKCNEITTQAGGVIDIHGLPLNTYYLKETQTLVGYNPMDSGYEFVLDVNASNQLSNPQNNTSIGNEEIKANLRLVKTDAIDPTVKLKDATYYLYRRIPYEQNKDTTLTQNVSESDYNTAAANAVTGYTGGDRADIDKYWTYVSTHKTDVNGEITVSNLPYGTYYFFEIQPAIGYDCDYEGILPTYLTASQNNTTVNINYANSASSHLEPRRTASAKVYKSDENGDPLNGAVFELYFRNNPLTLPSGLVTPRSDHDYIYFIDTALNGDAEKRWVKGTIDNTAPFKNRFKKTFETSNIYAYFYDENGTPVDGNWPGTLMWERYVDVNGLDVVYKVEPPANAKYVIFNDGRSNGGNKTPEIEFDLGRGYKKGNSTDTWDQAHLLYNYSTWYLSTNNNLTSSGGTITPTLSYVKSDNNLVITLDSDYDWDDLHIEFFDKNDQNIGQPFPGYLMENYGKSDGVDIVNNSNKFAYLQFDIIIPEGAKKFSINNGAREDGTVKNYYTDKIALAENHTKVNDGNFWHFQTKEPDSNNKFILETWDANGYNTVPLKISAGANGELSDGDYVYFNDLNSNKWYDKSKHPRIYAYFTNDDESVKYTNWPGIPAESSFSVSDGTIYRFKCPDTNTYTKVKFNNGIYQKDENNSIEISNTSPLNLSKGNGYKFDGTSWSYNSSTTTNYIAINSLESLCNYIYIINEKDEFDDLHIMFYDENGTPILQAQPGYIPSYIGTESSDNDRKGKWYKIAIPNTASKFSINNGYKSSALQKPSILADISEGGVFIIGDINSENKYALNTIYPVNADYIKLATITTGYDGLNSTVNMEGNVSDYAVLATDNKTIILKNWGYYYYKEITPPTGYVLPTNPYTPFIVDKDVADEVVHITSVKDDMSSGSVKVYKISAEDLGLSEVSANYKPAGTQLPGAKFKLYKYDETNNTNALKFNGSNGSYTYDDINGSVTELETWDDTGTTAVEGLFQLNKLPWGMYKLVEQSPAPTNYALDTDPIYFTIGRNNASSTIVSDVYVKDKVNKAVLTIDKEILSKNPAWGDPTFIFKVKQTKDYANVDVANGNEYTLSITLDGNKLTDSASVALEPGVYEVTELQVSRYGCSTVEKVDSGTPSPNDVSVTYKTATVTVKAGGKAEVKFTNTVGYYDKFSHTESRTNIFNGVKALSVSYNQTVDVSKNLIPGQNYAVMNIDKSALDPKLIKADGTVLDSYTFNYTNLTITKVTGIGDPNFDVNDNGDQITIIVEPIITAGYVYKLQAKYTYCGVELTTTFDLTFKQRSEVKRVTKKTVTFRADTANESYFVENGIRTSVLTYDYYIITDSSNETTIHEVLHDGVLVDKNNVVNDVNTAFNISEAYKKIKDFDEWHSSINTVLINDLNAQITTGEINYTDGITFTATLKNKTSP